MAKSWPQKVSCQLSRRKKLATKGTTPVISYWFWLLSCTFYLLQHWNKGKFLCRSYCYRLHLRTENPVHQRTLKLYQRADYFMGHRKLFDLIQWSLQISLLQIRAFLACLVWKSCPICLVSFKILKWPLYNLIQCPYWSEPCYYDHQIWKNWIATSMNSWIQLHFHS